MSDIDPLLTPFTMKHLTLRNRIVSTSHEPAYSVDGVTGSIARLPTGVPESPAELQLAPPSVLLETPCAVPA